MTVIHKSFQSVRCNAIAPFCNTETGKGYLIDPGGDPDLMQTIKKCKLEGIYHTHAHFDHFLASAEIKEKRVHPFTSRIRSISMGQS